jgi:hypothetical protein
MSLNISKTYWMNMYFDSIGDTRNTLVKKFMRIIQQVVVSSKLKWNEIKWDIDPISSFFSLELSG